MNSIDLESLLVIIFVLVDDWYQVEGKFLRGRYRGAKAGANGAKVWLKTGPLPFVSAPKTT